MFKQTFCLVMEVVEFSGYVAPQSQLCGLVLRSMQMLSLVPVQQSQKVFLMDGSLQATPLS
ncbi:MAG: hypothetical protein E8D41_01005 [Nitrospira sp.]|nr:MAG: hypothetical protein E8D41_01005 [Nitrospira sp.]